MSNAVSIIDDFKILDAALVGYEFEFYCELDSANAASSLSDMLQKKVVTAYKMTAKGKEKGAHTEQEVTDNIFKIEYDFSGGKNMMELITGPLPYIESKIILAKVLHWITVNAKTTDKCGIHLNISFDKSKVSKNIDIQNIDTLKFVLGYDEDFIYNRFPNRHGNVYARGIDHIYPLSMFFFNKEPKTIITKNYSIPTEKYYGVNFTKIKKGYLEIRYLGGKGYNKKIKEIIEVLDYTIKFMYNSLQHTDYTNADLFKLQNRLRDHSKFAQNFKDYETFAKAYQNITVSVDLKLDPALLTVYWETLKEKLFDLVVKCGMRSGYYNYDTDMSAHQIKSCNFRKPFYLQGYELISCKIVNATIERCVLAGCEVNSCILNNCKVFWGTNLESSKVAECILDADVKIQNSYIDNKEGIIRGEINNCIIRSGIISEYAIIDEETQII